jgi:hypothetical protein
MVELARDYALTIDEASGRATLHRSDCSDVRRQAELGLPVMTMLDCQREPPAQLRWRLNARELFEARHGGSMVMSASNALHNTTPASDVKCSLRVVQSLTHSGHKPSENPAAPQSPPALIFHLATENLLQAGRTMLA